jgi:hypothetical protein
LTGTCSPIPANTDPDKECVMIAPPAIDGGAVDAGEVVATEDAGNAAASEGGVDAGDGSASEAGATDAGDEGAADAGDEGAADAGEAGATDAATEAGLSLGYNPPDGGVVTDNSKCAGSCDGKGGNGKGGCVYPDNTKVCGTPFCNTSAQRAAFVCDQGGHCGLSLTDCADYACSSATGTCGTSCSAHTDCLPTDYCDGLNCRPTRGNGVPCTTPGECRSGYCNNSVCCDTDCTKTAGGNCNLNAAVAGTCSCSACSTGPCAVYYRDFDGDGYGDRDTPTVACAAGPVPTGYVGNNTDCDDGDPLVNPAQTRYFSTSSLVKHTFDYNCDGKQEKGIPEYPGFGTGNCGFCGFPQSTTPACSVSTTTCSSTGDQSTLGCSEYFSHTSPVNAVSRLLSAPALVGVFSIPYCAPSPTPDPNWQPDRGSGFAETVDCGSPGTFISCGTCPSSAGPPNSSILTNVVQTCR